MTKKTLSVCLLLVGCATHEPPPAPVPPIPDDLRTWSAPEIVGEVPPEEPPPVPVSRPAAQNERVYPYVPGTLYIVEVQLGAPADIALEPGEIIHDIVGGDRAPLKEGETARWEVKEGTSDSEHARTQHVFVTGSQVGQQMSVIVTTNRRTYYLMVRCVVKTPVRTVRWTYPVPLGQAKKAAPRQPSLLPNGSEPRQYHVGYRIDVTGHAPEWSPVQVLDDGRKTYILFPRTILYQVAPLVRLIGPQGPQLVNSRQVGAVYVIDQLIGRAELRVGAGEHAEIVTITREQVERIDCPGHPNCPVWPARSTGGTPS